MRKSQIDALFNETKQLLLSALLLHPDKWWYLSDLANNLKKTPSSLQRELSSLMKAEIINVKKEGNRVYYRANENCPFLPELQGVLIKTVGVRDVVFKAIKKFDAQIVISFIYGSIARKEELSHSDVDVMIIGNVKLIDLVSSLKNAENLLFRQINPTLYSLNEFIEKYRSRNNFIQTIIKEPKIFLIGSNDELKKLFE